MAEGLVFSLSLSFKSYLSTFELLLTQIWAANSKFGFRRGFLLAQVFNQAQITLIPKPSYV